jgi:hypothetical protein
VKSDSEGLTEPKSEGQGNQPQASRPHMPGYGLVGAGDGSGLFPWSRVGQHMVAARNYWIVTTRPDDRPHCAPVWGVWLDETFFFGTGRHSRKARNLAANPALVVHLESGDDVVIVEGVAEEVADPALLGRLDVAYFEKYQVHVVEASSQEPFFAVRPTVAFAWLERDLGGSATRWSFAG